MLFPSLDIFVDGGGNSCIGVDNYLKRFKKFDKVYVFEPNPYFHNSYKNKDLILIKKAIWIENCYLPFFISKDSYQASSSLLEEKLCRDIKPNGIDSELIPFFHSKTIEVQCVDFSEWILHNIKPHHNLTLKLDIEGAEYDVLSKMIDDGTIHYVKKLFVEFHLESLESKREFHYNLLDKLKNINLVAHEWQ